MKMIKSIGSLLVALIKLGFVHVVNFFDFIITKYFNSYFMSVIMKNTHSIKKPQETQSKIQHDEYISTKEYDY